MKFKCSLAISFNDLLNLFIIISGKRKLKKSAVFDQPVNNSSQNGVQEQGSTTGLFVLSKNSSNTKENTSDSKEDSQFSSYDASQHFERTDYSVTNMINQLDATIEKVPVDNFEAILYSDSDDDLWNSPAKSKRTCELTNSQKNVMDKTFEFDEVDRDVGTKKKRNSRKHGGCKKHQEVKSVELDKSTSLKLQESAHVSVMNSPTKMLTFNSNYADNSDIVTDIEPGTLEPDNDEITAIKRIKSPSIVPAKKQEQRKSSANATLNENNTKRRMKSAVQKTKTSLVSRVLLNDNSSCDDLHNEASKEQKNVELKSTLNKTKYVTESESQPLVSNPLPKEIVTNAVVVQAPEITSTSDSRPRRISKRVKQSSCKLSNPDFILDKSPEVFSKGKEQEISPKTRDTVKLSNESEKISSPGVTSNYDDSISNTRRSADSISTTRRSDDSIGSTRKSGRTRKTNPKYLQADAPVSVKSSKQPTMPSVDLSLLEELEPLNKKSSSHLTDVADSSISTTRKSDTRTSTSKSSAHRISDSRKSVDSVTTARRSSRQRKANSKYLPDAAISAKSTKQSVDAISSFDVPLSDLPSDKENTDKENTAQNLDQSVSEYSTTETPVVKKAVTKREKRAPVVTTTDTEDSAAERLDKRLPSKRKKTKKTNSSSQEVAAVVKRRSENSTAPTNVSEKFFYCTLKLWKLFSVL